VTSDGRLSQVILLIDALGWELAERTGFLSDLLPHRQRLRSVLGYSSAAIPSLLTGNVPREHGHWFLYFRARHAGDSPFTGARWIARLPRRIRESWTLRRRLGEWWSRRASIEGYFGLYDVPYRELADMDYIERRDTWRKGTFPGGSYIDDLADMKIPAFVSDWRVPDDRKLEAALTAARSDEAPRVYLVYLTEIDARQHAHGSHGAPVEERLYSYRQAVDRLLEVLGRSGSVALTVCSDHGMTDIRRVVDPFPLLEASGLDEGRDYRVFIDSTFLRFWPASPEAESRLTAVFGGLDWGHVLAPGELKREGVDFPDDRYGRLFVLADPGVLICPSYMGRAPLKGMHGYTPDDPASDAVLLRSSDSPERPDSILGLRRFFLRELTGAARP
jgi:hypothetical protein